MVRLAFIRLPIASSRVTSKGSHKKTSPGHIATLLREDVVIWQPGTYPTPDKHVLVVPFKFPLASELPPSSTTITFDTKRNIRTTSTISYYIEVVTVHHGFRRGKKNRIAFQVLPHIDVGMSLSASLSSWQGHWRTIRRHRNILEGTRGDTSHVQMSVSVTFIMYGCATFLIHNSKLTIPDIGVFPACVDIPYTLNIVTTSKLVRFVDDPGPVFPVPPTRAKDVTFELMQVTRTAGTKQSPDPLVVEKLHSRLGGLGGNVPPILPEKIPEVLLVDRTWQPSDDRATYGTWRQEVTFRSVFRLSCAPSLATPIMKVQVCRPALCLQSAVVLTAYYSVQDMHQNPFSRIR